MPKRYYILLLLLLALVGCQPKVVREAEAVLAASDSLRVKGIPPTDSALLAETTASLTPWRMLYPTDYAKANYYYGYLLRLRGHHPEAMRCFIEASKSKTRDYLLLGRVYANMANMCQLEGNYELAYTIYEKSKDQFEKAGNSRMYYYAWNNLALQRAFQKDKDKTYELLSVIERECTDSAVLTKILETKALVCRDVAEYDSVIYYVNQLLSRGYREATEFVIKTQSYNRLGHPDSALIYAQKALACPTCSRNDSINMLYVLSHNDTTLNGDSIRTITSERADKQFAYTHQQEELAKAVEYLQHDMQPNHLWLYGTIVALIISSVVLFVFFRVTKQRRELKRTELIEITTNIQEGKKEYSQLVDRNSDLRDENKSHYQVKYRQLQEECDCICKMSDEELKARMSWRDFDQLVEYTNTHMYGFVDKLYQQYPSLSEKEVRMCILSMIGVSGPRASELVPYAATGIRKFKSTTLQKIGFSGVNVREQLLELACK